MTEFKSENELMFLRQLEDAAKDIEVFIKKSGFTVSAMSKINLVGERSIIFSFEYKGSLAEAQREMDKIILSGVGE